MSDWADWRRRVDLDEYDARWQAMAAAGVTILIEVGSGKVLSGLAGRIDKTLTAVPVGVPQDIEAALALLHRRVSRHRDDRQMRHALAQSLRAGCSERVVSPRTYAHHVIFGLKHVAGAG